MELQFRQTGNRHLSWGHFALHATSPSDPSLRYVILDRSNGRGFEVLRVRGPICQAESYASVLVATTLTLSAAKVDAQLDHDAFISS